jgi:hypothetical protein
MGPEPGRAGPEAEEKGSSSRVPRLPLSMRVSYSAIAFQRHRTYPTSSKKYQYAAEDQRQHNRHDAFLYGGSNPDEDIACIQKQTRRCLAQHCVRHIGVVKHMQYVTGVQNFVHVRPAFWLRFKETMQRKTLKFMARRKATNRPVRSCIDMTSGVVMERFYREVGAPVAVSVPKYVDILSDAEGQGPRPDNGKHKQQMRKHPE